MAEVTCSECAGLGRVYRAGLRAPDAPYVGPSICLVCGGSGTIRTLSQLSIDSAGLSGSASFQIGVDYAAGDDFYSISEWPAQAVTADANSSPTTPALHMHEVAACLTLLGQQLVENNRLMAELIQTQKELAKAILEDGQSGGDDEELPARYLDGSRV